MKFSYNWLKDYVKNLPKPEKLAELLTMHSFEVVEVKKIGSDFILDIDILPNRAGDCFSHLGIAREISVITGSALLPTPDVRHFYRHRESIASKDFISVEVRSRSYCSRYTAKVITDVKVGPSPKWLKERLEVCGLNSINNIVDVANFVMLETGQPLHAFDAQKLDGQKLIVRFAKNGEKITTLDNQKFDLSSQILVIADAKKPLAIAGIKGGEGPEINKATKRVVLESANFNPIIIRKGLRELNLKTTDASLRFEHGIDPNLTEFAINKAAYLIQRVAGGSPAKDLIDFYPEKTYPRKIKLDLNYAESLLGFKIAEREIRNILKRLGFKIIGLRNQLLVEVPTWRLDISIPEDLIEEIGRIYGYEKIPAVFPSAVLIPPKRNDNIFWENMIKDILKETGFTEVYNYSFQNEESDIEVENPTSQEYKYLRSSLIPNLLRNIEKNIKNFNQIKIFEVGKVFREKAEKTMLTGLVVGYDFYQLKGVIDLLFNKLGIAQIWYDDYQATPEDSPFSVWHPKKCAEIKTNDHELGFLGELKNGKTAAFDLDFEKLQRMTSEEQEYRPLSKFPSAVRDLAILVPRPVKVEDVLNKIELAGGLLVRDVDLFDMYEGEELPQDKKNLAFHIIYQAEDRTLTSREVDKIHQKIIKTLEKNQTWQVRK